MTAAGAAGEHQIHPPASGGRLAGLRRHPFRVRAGLLALFGLAVRVGYVLVTPHYVVLSDAQHYLYRGEYLYRHHHLPPPLWGSPSSHAPDAYWPPLYAMFMATVDALQHALGFLGIGLIEAIRLAQACLWAVAVALVALIAVRLFGRRVAVIAAALLTIYPPLIAVGAALYSESLWLPLFLASIAALGEYRHRPRAWLLVASAVLAALGALTHSDGVYLFLPATVTLLVMRSASRRRRLARACLYLVVGALTIAPWTIRNEVKFHAFVPISNSLGNTLVGTYNPTSAHRSQPGVWTSPRFVPSIGRRVEALSDSQIRQDSVETHLALLYVERHPTYPIVVAFWNTLRLAELNGLGWAAYMSHWEGISRVASDVDAYVFWVLGLLALAGCCTRIVRRAAKWVWLIPLTMFLTTVLVQSEVPRFRAPIDPFLLILAAAALAAAWEKLEAARAGPQRMPGRRPGLAGEYANT